jgi:hypothetical protein
MSINELFKDFREEKSQKEIMEKYNLPLYLFQRYRMMYRSMVVEVKNFKTIKLSTPSVDFGKKKESYYTEEEMLKHPFIGKGAMKEMLNQIKYL